MSAPEPVRLPLVSGERPSTRGERGPLPTGARVLPRDDAAFLSTAAACGGDVAPMVALLREGAADGDAPLDLPLTGEGATREQWELLASVAAQDLSAARVLEPHLDALSILSQAGVPAPEGLLGVYASESGGQTPTVRRTADGWRLDGEKPWCSLADECSHAVVTAKDGDGGRHALLVDLGDPGVTTADAAWPALGLAPITTVGLRFADVPGEPVGKDEWYLTRPGFAWGGIGVAAVWFGGAVGIARTLRDSLRRRAAGAGPGPDQVGEAALGRVDRLLHAMGTLLARAAADVDAGRLDHGDGMLEADRIRGTVTQLCTEVLDVVGQATGPGPLTGNARHARAVADLQVYLRQHHGHRDDARLGRALLERGDARDAAPAPTTDGAWAW